MDKGDGWGIFTPPARIRKIMIIACGFGRMGAGGLPAPLIPGCRIR